MSSGWEEFLKGQFPAWLLPHAQRGAITVDAARAFLARFTHRGDALALVSAASLVVGRADALDRFTARLLPDLVRTLPARSVLERRTWEGGFHGALDLPRTQALHLAGQGTRFVTRQRRRSFALPENALVASVARRLLGLIEGLHRVDALREDAWGGPAAEALGRLRHLLNRTRLAEIPDERINGDHLLAARSARHPAFEAALDWHRDLDQVVERPIPEVLARQLADGALLPIREPKRFEIAVLLRLLQSVVADLEAAEPGAWRLEREVVLTGRRGPVARLIRGDGTHMDVYYDQAPFRPGPRDEALRHYLQHGGRLRPDALFDLHRADGSRRAAVVEVKCSSRRQTLVNGLTEAVVYQQELKSLWRCEVLALAVAAGGVPSAPRPGDALILTDWEKLGRLNLAHRLGALGS